MIFHDSFLMPADQRMRTVQPERTDQYRPPPSTFQLPSLLSEHFSRSVFAWQSFDPKFVESEHPDVVIEELVERYLVRGPQR